MNKWSELKGVGEKEGENNYKCVGVINDRGIFELNVAIHIKE